MSNYTEVTQEAGKEFYISHHGKGKIVMLNLIRFKAIADYSGSENLRPSQEISGAEAYHLYIEASLPELKKAGSKLLFFGDASSFLIGPESEQWDAVLLVEHESAEKFIEFAQNADYLKTMGHRTAAVLDSRLMPIKRKEIFFSENSI